MTLKSNAQIRELVKRAQNDDREAFNELVEIYTPYIKSMARRYIFIGGDIEDLIQTGFIGMCYAIKKYNLKSEASFKTFLYMCVQSEIKNSITKANNNKNKALQDSISIDVEDEDEDAWAYVLVSSDKTPEEQTIQKQKLKIIFKKLKEVLKQDELKILEMYLQGYKYIEISNKLNKETKFVDNTLSKIKRLLQKLKEEEDL